MQLSAWLTLLTVTTADPSWIEASQYPSIQAAVDALPARGGVVHIAGGVYTSATTPAFGQAGDHPGVALRVSSPKIVHLLGDGKDVTILRGDQADSDLVQLRGDRCMLEGLTIENAARPGARGGTSRAIVIGDPGRVMNGPALRDVRITNSVSWSVYILGQKDFPGTLALLGDFHRVDSWGNQGPGAFYVGRGCTTLSFRNCYIQPFRGCAIDIDHAEGIALDECVFESHLDHDQPYVWLDGSNVCKLDHCWFEAHGLADTSRFVHLRGPLHSITIEDCRFARDDATTLHAVQVDGTCKSVFITNPEMAVTQPSTGDDDITIENSAREPSMASEVSVVGGAIGTPTRFMVPTVRDRSGRTTSSGLGEAAGALARSHLPALSDAEIVALPQPHPGDLVFNTSTQHVDVFTGAGGWVGIVTGSR